MHHPGFLFGAEALTLAVLPDYFDKHFDTANVIVHFGMSTGVIVMPLLTQFLQDVYGWRGAMFIIGGLYLHPLVFAALIRPNGTKHGIRNGKSTKQGNDENEDDQCNEKCGLQTEHAGSLSCNEENASNHHFSFINAIANTLDLHLFKNPKVLSQYILNIGCSYLYTGWLIYLVPHGLDLGFEPYEASALATVGGFGNLIGSIVYMLQLKVMTNEQILYSSVIVTSISLLLDPVFSASKSYVGLMVLSFVMNVGNATWNCQ